MRDATLIERAKRMRANPTPAEWKLWHELGAKRFNGYNFRRQVVIDRYIADFACRTPEMVIIEVDGDSHDYQGQYDERRTRDLEARGDRILRFANDDVLKNLDGVLALLDQQLCPSPGLASLDHPLP